MDPAVAPSAAPSAGAAAGEAALDACSLYEVLLKLMIGGHILTCSRQPAASEGQALLIAARCPPQPTAT
jgi:hypothetical protein